MSSFKESFMLPKLPPYDPIELRKQPFTEQARQACAAWALEGYGSPPSVYLVYALKVVGYIAGWIAFCGFTPGLGSWTSIDWWLHPVAFQKAIAWSMLFEVLGLGCGSGPLTGRYLPPLGGFLYFLRPGTTKLPFFPGVPLIGTIRRTVLDAGLYLALIIFSVLALIHPQPGYAQWLPLFILVPLLGLLDKTIFLAARAEHYWVTITVFAFAQNWIAGAMVVQLALWFYAGLSKLNHHFPTVVCVMASNGPFTPWQWFRKKMYRDYPNDLNPSDAAVIKSRIGTALEFSVPIVMLIGLFSGSYTIIIAGLVLMLMLHSYITSNVPMGVPIEWNFMVVYAGFFLFGANSHIMPLAVGNVPLAIFLVVVSVILPFVGNIIPERFSFLLAMRYYAGNWPMGVWLFKGDAHKKLDRLKKSSPWVLDQLNMLYPEKIGRAVASKLMAFRLMHLHGRALPGLVDKAVGDRFTDYTWMDGEVVCGLVLGYNFGEGHLHKEQMIEAMQQQCEFEEGEVRVILMEPQSLFGYTQEYRIVDAKTGLMEKGRVDMRPLRTTQPWQHA